MPVARPVRVAHDLAARRRLRVAVDLHERHRALVDEDGMAARMNEHDGMVRRCLAERVVNGQPLDEHALLFLPLVLVPAAPDDPFADRRVGRRFRHHRHDLGEALRVAEVQDQQRVAEAGVVPVALDEARDHRLPLQVDDFGLFAAIRRHRLGCAPVEDAITLDRDGFRARESLVHGNDIGVDEQQVGDGSGFLRVGAIATSEQCDRKKHQGPYRYHPRDSTRLPAECADPALQIVDR